MKAEAVFRKKEKNEENLKRVSNKGDNMYNELLIKKNLPGREILEEAWMKNAIKKNRGRVFKRLCVRKFTL